MKQSESPIQVIEQLCVTLHAQGELIHPRPTEALTKIVEKAQKGDGVLSCDQEVCVAAYPIHLGSDDLRLMYNPPDYWEGWVWTHSPEQAIEAAKDLHSNVQNRRAMPLFLTAWPEVSEQLITQGFHPRYTYYRCPLSEIEVKANKDIRVRRYTLEDIDAFIDFSTELTETDYSFVPEVSHEEIDLRAFKRREAEEELPKWLEMGVVVNMAFHGTRPEGYISYFVTHEGKRIHRPEEYVVIGSMVVTENARRQGVGSTLVAHMLAELEAQENVPELVFVESITASPMSNPFYLKLGFRPVLKRVIGPALAILHHFPVDKRR